MSKSAEANVVIASSETIIADHEAAEIQVIVVAEATPAENDWSNPIDQIDPDMAIDLTVLSVRRNLTVLTALIIPAVGVIGSRPDRPPSTGPLAVSGMNEKRRTTDRRSTE